MTRKRNPPVKIIGAGKKRLDRMTKSLKISFFLWTLLVVCQSFSPAAEIPYVWTGVERIVAVGDLHGDYDNFILILKNPKVGLVDDNLHWSGGKTHLVQIGDIMDRGDKAKEILDLLMRLEKEAEAAGGKAHILLGNHEELNITGMSLGYPSYVSARQFVSFLPEKFRKARENQLIDRLPADEQALIRIRGGKLKEDERWLDFWSGILRQVRQRNDPEAALAYIQNFNRRYGKWLLQKNCVIKINDIVFAHGGISLRYSSWKLKDINDLLRMELWAYALRPTNPLIGGQPFQPKMVYNPESPLWYRQDSVASQPEIDEILANLGARRMIIGHNFAGAGGGSPIIRQEDSVARFENKVWMIDTGIGYSDIGGTLYALIIDQGNFDFFAGTAEAVGPSSEEPPTSEGPQTPDELEKFLNTSTPKVVVPGAAGRTDPWRVRLESDGITRWAQFKYINRPRPEPIPDSFKYELAAYELNKYLDLSLVPPAVERTINDTPGSLQAFIENAIRKSDIKRENFVPADPEAFDQAMADLKVFENLVYDRCDNEKDTLIQKDSGRIYRVDFSEAFAPENGTIPGCEILRCSRRLYQKLQEWDPQRVETLLAPYLNEEESRALHARQGSIIQMIKKQIEERGESAVLF
jgi:hypothetical protein